MPNLSRGLLGVVSMAVFWGACSRPASETGTPRVQGFSRLSLEFCEIARQADFFAKVTIRSRGIETGKFGLQVVHVGVDEMIYPRAVNRTGRDPKIPLEVDVLDQVANGEEIKTYITRSQLDHAGESAKGFLFLTYSPSLGQFSEFANQSFFWGVGEGRFSNGWRYVDNLTLTEDYIRGEAERSRTLSRFEYPCSSPLPGE
jgi:hypothetical protein